MPAATRIITLNIGSQMIGLAEFRLQSHGGLSLLEVTVPFIEISRT